MTTNTTETTTSADDLLAALAELEVIEGVDAEQETPAAETHTESATASDAIDDVDALLADLELSTPVATETQPLTAVESSDTEITDEMLDALEATVALEEAKKEAYETAESVSDDKDVEIKAGDSSAEISKASKEPKMKARASGDSKPSAALVARLGNVDAVYNQLVFFAEDATKSAEDLKAECDKRLKSFDALPKKIGEKAVNLVTHLAGGASLSVYTQIALEMLFNAGELSSKALVEHYMARPYSEGTSRSQAGQIMRLVQAFGIADGSSSHVTLNKDSIIGQALKEVLIGKAA